MSSQPTSEVIDLTGSPSSSSDPTDANRRKNEALVRFYKTAFERSIKLVDPGHLEYLNRKLPDSPAPDSSLSDQQAYYFAAADVAGGYLEREHRFMNVYPSAEPIMESWEKGAAVIAMIYFGPFIEPSVTFFPLWMEPVLTEVGTSLLAHGNKGVCRNPTLLLACLGLEDGSIDPPLAYVCEPDEFFVAHEEDVDGCEQEPEVDISDAVWDKARAKLKEGRTYQDWTKVGRDFAARFRFIQEFGIERAMEFENAREAGYSVGPGAPEELLGRLRVGGEGKAFGGDGTPLW